MNGAELGVRLQLRETKQEYLYLAFAPSKTQSSTKTIVADKKMAAQSLISKGWNIFHHDTWDSYQTPTGKEQYKSTI